MDATGAWRGELRWAVKASFLDYVRANGGSIDLEGGASEADGEFVFPRGVDGLQIDGDRPRGSAKFVGGVRFTAHGGMLDVVIAEPRIEFRERDARLIANDVDGDEIEYAILEVGGPLERDDVLEWVAVTTRLSSDGADAFFGVYPAWIELDPVSFRLAR